MPTKKNIIDRLTELGIEHDKNEKKEDLMALLPEGDELIAGGDDKADGSDGSDDSSEADNAGEDTSEDASGEASEEDGADGAESGDEGEGGDDEVEPEDEGDSDGEDEGVKEVAGRKPMEAVRRLEVDDSVNRPRYPRTTVSKGKEKQAITAHMREAIGNPTDFTAVRAVKLGYDPLTGEASSRRIQAGEKFHTVMTRELALFVKSGILEINKQ